MSQSNQLSNQDSRLSIDPEDVDYLVGLAKLKGFTDSDVATLYVVAAVGIPVEEVVHTEEELRETASLMDRMIYDENKKRLVGFNPPLQPRV